MTEDSVSSGNSTGKIRRRGFSMIELMTVVVLIGILSAIAVPRMFVSHSLSALDGDFTIMKQVIERGRKAAMKTGVRHYMTINPATRTWSLYKEKSNPLNMVYDAGTDSLVARDTLSPSVRFGFGFSAPPKIVTTRYASPTAGLVDVNPVSGGIGKGNASDPCVDNASAPGPANWTTITFCGGATSAMESGVLYLSTTRSDRRLHAIVYNPNVDLHLLRFTWNGTQWNLD